MIWKAPPRPVLVSLEPWAEEFIDAMVTPPGFRRVDYPVGFVRDRDPLYVMVSGRTEGDGRRWIHVSLSHPNRCPTWATIRLVKDALLGRNRRAIQVLAPESEWVNLHPYCLHLWCCLDEDGLPDFRVDLNERKEI